MAKTKENNEHYLDLKNDKDYLQDLLLNIKDSYQNQETVFFKIIESKEKGFVVKIKGLFAFVSFYHFAWIYPSTEFWKNASDSLIGKYFRGKIHSITENPISIIIDAHIQQFDIPELKKLTEYQGIILLKVKYGAFVDLGVHFNWKYGSLLGLIHKSTLKDESEYDNWRVGEKITTFFQGFNEDGKPILGNDHELGKWISGEMNELVGTIQKIKVVKNENIRPEFYALGKHKARIPISKEFYPDTLSAVREYLNEVKNGETITCKVIKINRKNNAFVVKLLIEPQVS